MPVSRRSRVLASLALAATASGVGLAATPSASAAQAPTLASGVKTRTQVPWASVTKGWVVAQIERGGHQNLVLVSPAGQSYQIMTVDGMQLSSVSPDGKRVLMDDDKGFVTIDLASGRVISRPGLYNGGWFTRPNGLGVLGTNSTGNLVNYSATTGKLTTTGARVGLAPWAMLPSPSGTSDLVSTNSSLTLYNHATLKPIRSFAAPKGYSLCQPYVFVNGATFRETCVDTRSMANDAMNATTEVFEQSVNGGAPRAVTNGTYPAGVTGRIQLGFGGAWQTSKGTIAAPNVAVFTGSTRLFHMVGGKIAQTYTVPMAADAAKMMPMVKTMQGNSAYFMTNLHEPGPSIALRYDVTTGKVNYLGGNHSQYGGVVSRFEVAQ